MSDLRPSYERWWDVRGQFDPHATWWVETFRERDVLLRDTFGETVPPGGVIAFDWEDRGIRVPGGCAMVFPPCARRSRWLTITHGLAQPNDVSEVKNGAGTSGYGWEFGIVTKQNRSWGTDLLYRLMTYVRESGRALDRGHRIPAAFYQSAERPITVELGSPTACRPPYGNIRAFICWPLMEHPRGFTTSTGRFGILIATGITEIEWQLAKEAGSSHLLLLLFKAGVGQDTNPGRLSVVDDPRWSEEWLRLRDLSEAEADCALASYGQW